MSMKIDKPTTLLSAGLVGIEVVTELDVGARN
jgi:hypothetical protein